MHTTPFHTCRWLIPPLVLLVAMVVALPKQPTPVLAQPQVSTELTTDLQLVPRTALGFVHVRVAELWRSTGMSDIRRMLLKAGPAAFDTLDADFLPKPSTIERVTAVLLPFKDENQPDVRMVTILAFNTAFDADKVKKQYIPKAETLTVNEQAYVSDRQAGIALFFADDKTLVFGDAETIPQYLKLRTPKESLSAHPLMSSLQTAAKAPLSAVLKLKSIKPFQDLGQDLPLDIKPVLKAEWLHLQADMTKDTSIAMSLKYANETEAKDGEKALRKAADFARNQLAPARQFADQMIVGTGKRQKGEPRDLEELPQAILGIGALAAANTVDDVLAELPLKTQGNTVGLQVDLPSWTSQYIGGAMLAAGVALPALQRVRNSAARLQSANNLKQITLALHNYESAFGVFPPAAICDKKGNKLLSWRVAILPFIEQENLYRQFKLDEPWDSEHNKKFSESAIKTYMDPRAEIKKGELNRTHYKLFVGGGAAFDWVQGKKFVDIRDGSSNTVMVVSAGDPVPWAKPEDFEFDPKAELPNLKVPFKELMCGFCDGSVRTLHPESIKDFEKVMKLLIQADDGQLLPEFDK